MVHILPDTKVRGTVEANENRNEYWIYKIELRDQKDLIVKLEGEGSHFVAYIKANEIPSPSNYTWSFSDT
jgi:hypothetical protein